MPGKYQPQHEITSDGHNVFDLVGFTREMRQNGFYPSESTPFEHIAQYILGAGYSLRRWEGFEKDCKHPTADEGNIPWDAQIHASRLTDANIMYENEEGTESPDPFLQSVHQIYFRIASLDDDIKEQQFSDGSQEQMRILEDVLNGFSDDVENEVVLAFKDYNMRLNANHLEDGRLIRVAKSNILRNGYNLCLALMNLYLKEAQLTDSDEVKTAYIQKAKTCDEITSSYDLASARLEYDQDFEYDALSRSPETYTGLPTYEELENILNELENDGVADAGGDEVETGLTRDEEETINPGDDGLETNNAGGDGVSNSLTTTPTAIKRDLKGTTYAKHFIRVNNNYREDNSNGTIIELKNIKKMKKSIMNRWIEEQDEVYADKAAKRAAWKSDANKQSVKQHNRDYKFKFMKGLDENNWFDALGAKFTNCPSEDDIVVPDGTGEDHVTGTGEDDIVVPDGTGIDFFCSLKQEFEALGLQDLFN